MEQRLERLEQAISELQTENRRLRTELEELRTQLEREVEPDAGIDSVIASAPARRKFWSRWPGVVLIILIVVLPVVTLSFWHVNAFWSTFIGTLNGLFLYIIGPGIWRLLMEGLFRAIPGVLLGQSARLAVDRFRAKKGLVRQPALQRKASNDQ